MIEENIESIMDSPNISNLLEKIILPEDISEDALHNAISDMARDARLIMSVNGCGGLPGPLFAEETKLRKIINFFENKWN